MSRLFCLVVVNRCFYVHLFSFRISVASPLSCRLLVVSQQLDFSLIDPDDVELSWTISVMIPFRGHRPCGLGILGPSQYVAGVRLCFNP